MIDWTDKHCRYFHRLLTSQALLYTEMVTTGAVEHGDRDKILGYNQPEHPIALQLGGSDPKALAAASVIAEQLGYDEINLNVGCPSDRVQSGSFGACLMAEPQLVAECVQAMEAAVSVPITVKCRIGIDDQDSEADLTNFVQHMVDAQLQSITIHARKAWLNGLSPKQNRDVPPLDYDRVYRIKQKFPALEVIINGGIKTLDQALTHLQHVDGAMLGRAAYQTPWILSAVDEIIFDAPKNTENRHDIAHKMLDYIDNYLTADITGRARAHHITRHMIFLFQGIEGARKYRQILSVEANKLGAGSEVLAKALTYVNP
ncbi:MAG: tRNA dihydrouridine(20/20a) synthase DusA [Rhizobiales bacterium]|nr:tRNA dihydrouridine(20/20a) synthase DusA [Hyphomicrobiales bacterium]NRB13058.1 tRNA dihydrouridine(20/20a) synthase DusA [Hyphomicrobiales bacterium]